MKALTLFIVWCSLILLPCPHPAQAGYFFAAATAGGYSYLVQQDFEGTGYTPANWSENGSGGTADEDYTGVVLEGSQSLRIVTSTQFMRPYTAVTPSNNLTMCFMLRFITAPTDYVPFVQIWDGSTFNIGSIDLESGKFYLEHGISQAAGSMSYSTGVTYYCWLEWAKSTSTNGVLNLYVSTTTTHPGSPDATRTAGTATAQAEFIAFGPQVNATGEFIIDHVRVVAGAAGTVTTWPP